MQYALLHTSFARMPSGRHDQGTSLEVSQTAEELLFLASLECSTFTSWLKLSIRQHAETCGASYLRV